MTDKQPKSKNPIPKNFQNNTITKQGYKSKSEEHVLAPVADGAIGSTTRPMRKAEAKQSKQKVEAKKEAIFSERNASWVGVGTVSRGYNIVTPEEATAWLTRKYVRQATPEEVAREFGI